VSKGGRERSRKVVDALVGGPLRVVARPAYAATVRAELAVQRLADRTSPQGHDPDRVLDGPLTAVIKAFERPRLLRRLVASLRRGYPNLRVVVVDDSRDPPRLPGVETIVLPCDSGVSGGRQAGLDAVETEYVLMLDDDFVFWRHTGLVDAMTHLDRHPQIDLVGGRLVNLPLFRSVDYPRLTPAPGSAAVLAPLMEIGGLPVMAKVSSVWVARTERLRLVGWDPALKRLDHGDFFNRARGVLTTVLDADLSCLHAKELFDRDYRAFRDDVAADKEVLRQRRSRRV
jgi:glycosyltransferase involved in cell wall biosynthesis